MQNFTLYELKFWRYLIVGVGIILSLIFGLIFSPVIELIKLSNWEGLYLLLITIGSMILGIVIGAKVSTYTYSIGINEQGLNIVMNSPFSFSTVNSKHIFWNEIIAIKKEEYYNGVVVRMQLSNPAFEYTFTNSQLKTSDDLASFYLVIKAHINSVDLILPRKI